MYRKTLPGKIALSNNGSENRRVAKKVFKKV
jgi:hypothetical protein